MSSTVFGIHVALSQLKMRSGSIKEVLIQDNYKHNRKLDLIFQLTEGKGLKPTIVSKKRLDELVNRANHQGVVLQILDSQKVYRESDLDAIIAKINDAPLLLILDHIQDPHNLGACLRTAAAAGVHAVIAPKDGAASINPTVQKVACGATDVIPYVQVTNLVRTMKYLQQAGFWITGTALNAEELLYAIDFTAATAIVIGSEGGGMRRLVAENCDYLVKVPMSDKMESLNASVATGICLFEVVRQRQESS